MAGPDWAWRGLVRQGEAGNFIKWRTNMTQTFDLDVVIPFLPTSVNQLYRWGKGHMYKTQAAKVWAKDAALIIGSANQGREWTGYWLEVTLDICLPNLAWRDLDNCAKLTLDTLAKKLGFDDRYILSLHLHKWPTDEKLRIRLKKLCPLKEMDE